jgi:hypothetical protein
MLVQDDDLATQAQGQGSADGTSPVSLFGEDVEVKCRPEEIRGQRPLAHGQGAGGNPEVRLSGFDPIGHLYR